MLTDLKVSSFTCKYVFYRPEHNARRGIHKTEFWSLEMQKWNIATDSLDQVLFSTELEFPKI